MDAPDFEARYQRVTMQERLESTLRALDRIEWEDVVTPDPEPAEMFESVCYMVVDTLGRVKIGRTGNLPSRMSNMQVDNGSELVLLALFPDGARTERIFHRKFSAQKIRGEWYALSTEDIKRACEIVEPYDLPPITLEDLVADYRRHVL